MKTRGAAVCVLVKIDWSDVAIIVSENAISLTYVGLERVSIVLRGLGKWAAKQAPETVKIDLKRDNCIWQMRPSGVESR
ncbi:hypothetical protein TH1_07575 [Thalassospira lucentensis MCCC 1A00383 = DSM 14000]|nr:hypothetical protein TH1_07575 [Thalassospira lucentensis MCCC 1A00383 = DSM 14000]